MLDTVNTLPEHIPMKWLMLLVPLLIIIVWHYYQHQAFSRHVKNPTPKLFLELLNAARWRTTQLVGVWILSILLVAGGDLRYYKLAEKTRLQAQPVMLEPLNFQKSAQPPQAAPVAETSSLAATTPPNTASAGTDVQENQKDTLKYRYEDAFVSYFYLNRCKHADVADVALINEALAKEVAAIGASSDVQLSIFSAAQGSYESIYSDTPCDAEYLEPVARQFEDFMQKIY